MRSKGSAFAKKAVGLMCLKVVLRDLVARADVTLPGLKPATTARWTILSEGYVGKSNIDRPVFLIRE